MTELEKMQHVSTNENVNEEVSSSASPQKGELRSSESAFLTKKATRKAGYYISAHHQKPREPHVERTKPVHKHLLGLNGDSKNLKYK